MITLILCYLVATWEAPIQFVDGKPIVAGDIKEYRIYKARTLLVVVSGDRTSADLPVLPVGTSSFTVRAVSKDGLESAASNTVKVSSAKPPTVLRVE
jgi:hypothetical protein